MKKIIRNFLLLFTVLFIAVGCGSDETNTDDNKLTIWAWDKQFNIAALEEAKERYISENPDVEIEIMEYAQNDLMNKLNTGLSSGSTEGLPNIVLIEDYRIPGILSSYPDAVKDLSDIVDYDKFAQYKVENMTVDGASYGVPFDSGVTGFFYRTDLIEEAGYTVEEINAGITWDKYIEIAEAVKRETGANMITFDPSRFDLYRVMMQSAGEWYTDSSGKLTMADNEKLETILIKLDELMNAEGVGEHLETPQQVGDLNQGKTASAITGGWFAASISQEESQKGLWQIAPIPVFEELDSVAASNLGGSSWYVLDNVGNSELATDFLNKTFATDVDLYDTLIEEINLIPTFLPASETENIDKENEFFSNQKTTKNFLEWAEQIPPISYGTDTYAIEDILETEYQNMKDNSTAAEILQSAEEQAKSQLGLE